MIGENQMPKRFKDIVDEELAIFPKTVSVTERNSLPPTHQIPIENPTDWIRVRDVICVFVDMKGSTKLSASTGEKSTASVYRLFTSTAVKLFHEFDAPYIDVKGDGVFALFNEDQPYRALCAAVTFKTFAQEEFVPKAKSKTGEDVGYHIGIDQKTILVRKIGLKMVNDRTDRQNEVWAGKTVNMAAKLASKADSSLLVSDRYFDNFTDKKSTHSCGCGGSNEPQPLWTDVDVSGDPLFDFDTAHRLESAWCKTHGREFCDYLLDQDVSE